MLHVPYDANIWDVALSRLTWRVKHVFFSTWSVLLALRRAVMSPENQYNYVISYGKLYVPVYRMYASPMQGVKPIPESPFRGTPNILFAAEVDLEVFGNNF